jgi:hypothetical protein
MVFGTPPVTAITIFAAYEANVGKINATLTFPILSLFNILRFPLVVLPKAMRATSDMLNSIERIQVRNRGVRQEGVLLFVGSFFSWISIPECFLFPFPSRCSLSSKWRSL